MTKEQKRRIKEELILIRDERLGKGFKFICPCCEEGETIEFLHENKPSAGNEFESFTKGEFWRGSLSWWRITFAARQGRLEELMEEKKRYLTQLIETL